MILKKKTWPKFFKEIKDGKKNFEVRLADWKCKPGDLLILREWDPKTEKYTGRKIGKKVTYVLKTKGLKFFSKKDIGKYGYQIIGFR
ncbi:hypothetical protein A2V56_05395 [Candidatus Woesebacteria bacterium RBG_19FT_COMBO_42_9]|uniref:DUF3850 domain-containing protein n=1 Tax=Candidatus Woesebacteria bacterium RBG_16_42_24 TaxID=1802485 RepID=A0A1F7XNK8_9BACT|nr:MAG: hypothetical protein A2V97_03750 [Candidatus Woesebacteria bacterium RBG_16_42_24]OGM17312.1 MAG: hypothetical protein A2V56_05395 [Candidatus Woesebacteria bacterium RBG_19FT_COMBO_42_9]OGM67241.1 MAG: hypothetical protein A2985_03775 [Candidatus Woesebacteria bacterium RIFCSPLOWO2_01_FULL_43_11]